MSNCEECKHFQQELDINYQGCAKDDYTNEDHYTGKVECPYFDDTMYRDTF